jgi:hypothetical protein
LNEKQIDFLGCVCDVLDIQRPEFNDLTAEQHHALLDCFNTLVKSKKSKTTKEKSDTSYVPKKPGNVWISWLKINRDALKAKNGGEDGLAAILKEKYTAFKKTPEFVDLQNECAEKMREYKEKSDVDSDDEKPKKKSKAKKVEKSPEEKKPLNVYMAFLKEHLDEIKANLGGKSFNEAKKDAYAAFQKTEAFKTLEAKCKNELRVWNETKAEAKVDVKADVKDNSSDEEETKPPKKTKKTKVEVVSLSEEAPKDTKPKKVEKKSKKVDKKEESDEEAPDAMVVEKPKKAEKKSEPIQQPKPIEKSYNDLLCESSLERMQNKIMNERAKHLITNIIPNYY